MFVKKTSFWLPVDIHRINVEKIARLRAELKSTQKALLSTTLSEKDLITLEKKESSIKREIKQRKKKRTLLNHYILFSTHNSAGAAEIKDWEKILRNTKYNNRKYIRKIFSDLIKAGFARTIQIGRFSKKRILYGLIDKHKVWEDVFHLRVSLKERQKPKIVTTVDFCSSEKYVVKENLKRGRSKKFSNVSRIWQKRGKLDQRLHLLKIFIDGEKFSSIKDVSNILSYELSKRSIQILKSGERPRSTCFKEENSSIAAGAINESDAETGGYLSCNFMSKLLGYSSTSSGYEKRKNLEKYKLADIQKVVETVCTNISLEEAKEISPVPFYIQKDEDGWYYRYINRYRKLERYRSYLLHYKNLESIKLNPKNQTANNVYGKKGKQGLKKGEVQERFDYITEFFISNSFDQKIIDFWIENQCWQTLTYFNELGIYLKGYFEKEPQEIKYRKLPEDHELFEAQKKAIDFYQKIRREFIDRLKSKKKEPQTVVVKENKTIPYKREKEFLIELIEKYAPIYGHSGLVLRFCKCNWDRELVKWGSVNDSNLKFEKFLMDVLGICFVTETADL